MSLLSTLLRSSRAPRPIDTVRVLHVLPYVYNGGVERRRVTLGRHLGPRFEQRAVCLAGDGPVLADLRSVGTRVTIMGAPNAFAPYAHLTLHRIVRSWRPHIIHGAIFEGMVLAGLTGITERVPVTLLEETSCPSPDAPAGKRRSRLSRFGLRQIARHTDGIIAVAPTVGEFLRAEQRIPPSLVHDIMNGVEPFPLADRDDVARERQRLGIAPGDFVIGTAARIFDEHKRISDLIEAFATLTNRPGLHLLVIGDGPDLDRLRDLAARRGVADRTTFAGHREDRSLFYALMDAYVLSSATEAAPLGLMEAMMVGLPAVATTVGGVREIARHAARLVPPYRPDRIAEELRALIMNPDARARLGEDAAAVAGEHLTASRYARDVRALYLARLRRAGYQLVTAPDE